MTLFQKNCDISLDCLIYDGKRFFRGNLPDDQKTKGLQIDWSYIILGFVRSQHTSGQRAVGQRAVRAL